MIVEFRDMNDKLALHTNIPDMERLLKRLPSCIYWAPYYDGHNGTIIGVDLYFEKSARKMLLKVANSYQLPLC
ncbi:hypothetical protein ACFLUJ_03405 [Chloroflexota bacterium]